MARAETAPPLPPAEVVAPFPAASRLRSRDVFRLLVRIWPFVRPYKRHLILLFLIMLPTLPVGLFAIQIIRVFFDVVGRGARLTAGEAWMLHVPIGASREMVLWHACVATGAVAAIVFPYGAATLAYAVWLLQRIANLFRVDLYARLQELSLRFHADEKIGDAIFRMFQDSAAIPQVIDGLVIQPIRFLPYALASFGWLFMYNTAMGLIALVLLPIDFALAWLYGNALRPQFRAERETSSLATSRIEETLASIKTVKAFSREDYEDGRYAEDNWNSFIAARRARLMLARYRVWTNTARGFAYVTALYVGAHQVLIGGTTGLIHAAASLGFFQGSLAMFAHMSVRSRRLANQWGSLQDVAVAMARVLEMIAMPQDERIRSGDKPAPSAPRVLKFEHVSFGYDPRSPVLTDVSISAEAGSITALAGASGSGKSTIIALLLRFFDPTEGWITIDGTPIEELELASWRRTLAVALQENPLLTATLRDNVAYGRIGATDAEILTALERVALGDFVAALPAGLDTMLGEKGAKLSTGQAQRIGIARALVRDAPILILDEPTSALDSAAEEIVMRGIRYWIAERPAHRSVIIATHRLTTAARADRTYQIVAGRVTEDDSGTRRIAAEASHG